MTALRTVGPVIAAARAEGRAALVGYLPAGFPTVAGSVRLLQAMLDGGCDVVEIGLPYSDPVLDGPTVQRAAETALQAGTRTRDVLHVVEEVAATGPALVMTYWNPIERYGVSRFAADFSSAGGAGLITPDLTPDEAAPWIEAADAHALDKVFLVAPSSGEARLRSTAAACRGFVYAASVMGVTGTRTATSSAAPGLVGRVRDVTDTPVCVGLGVSNGAQAAEIAAYADGVIV
ncbi:MAG: tryptophan synthase subunit alpha, partial [Actinomycetes bacterium]